MRLVWVLACMLLVSSALAGCGSKTDSTDSGTDSGSGTGSGTGSKSGTATGTATSKGTGTATGTKTSGQLAGYEVKLTADSVTGTAPLNVTFSLSAGKDAKSWRLSFGDGSEAITGNAPLPATKSYTYNIGGNFSAILNVTFEDKKFGQDIVRIEVAVPDQGPPPETHFEFGPSAGCAGDFLQTAGQNCISFVAGPAQTPIDGHWQALDSRYWGKALTGTIDPAIPGDSDCFFVAADEHTITGEANNGALTCEGTVPGNTAWIFIYPYGNPANGMTIDFVI